MKRIIIITAMLCICISSSCMKTFLDEKPNKKIVVPKTLKDIQALLDNDIVMNIQKAPNSSVICADEYFVKDAAFNSSMITHRNAYLWKRNIYEERDASDWNLPFAQIFYANLVLEGLKDISILNTNKSDWDNAKGSALFFRAWAFYQLTQIFCKTYNANTAEINLGMPLRLESDINIDLPRATLKQTYERIIADLNESLSLLPSVPLVKTRPSKAAADALLARVYLLMEDFEKAGSYANDCLKQYSTLLDYSKINSALSFPIPMFNDEVIFHNSMSTTSILNSSRLIIDPLLYVEYDGKDLRRSLFFFVINGSITYKGSYDGTKDFFAGIAVDEVLLMRAECYARKDKVGLAMADLNKLLEKRYNKNDFVPKVAADMQEALSLILIERRKQLLFRGLRWYDLRRLNKDPLYSKTLTRVIDGKLYELKPNDPGYVLQIPDREIALSGLIQNP